MFDVRSDQDFVHLMHLWGDSQLNLWSLVFYIEIEQLYIQMKGVSKVYCLYHVSA